MSVTSSDLSVCWTLSDTLADTTMMGIAERLGSCLILLISSMPLIKGMLMSIVMRSTCCSRIMDMANSPSLASRMVKSGNV